MTESYTPFVINYITESSKLYRQFLFFGFILLVAHLLDLQPQKYSGFGLSVDIDKQSYLYGVLAIIVLYKFMMASYYEIIGNCMTKFRWFNEMEKSISSYVDANEPDTEEEAKKRIAKIYTNLAFAFMFPFILVVFAVAMLSIVVAVHDVWVFISDVASLYIDKYSDWL